MTTSPAPEKLVERMHRHITALRTFPQFLSHDGARWYKSNKAEPSLQAVADDIAEALRALSRPAAQGEVRVPREWPKDVGQLRGIADGLDALAAGHCEAEPFYGMCCDWAMKLHRIASALEESGRAALLSRPEGKV